MSVHKNPIDLVRRSFILKSCGALGALTAADLLGMTVPLSAQTPGQPAAAAPGRLPGILNATHHPARAKRVIYLHMLGAMSHVDTFDYKPTLARMHGQDLPASVRNTQRLSTMSAGQTAFPIVGPLARFQQRGQSGQWISDFLPHIAGIADDICIVKTMHTEHVNHDPAAKFLHTGFQLAGRPSNGAWVSYGLGSDNTDLPSYVVMTSGASQGVPLDQMAWSAGFLPSHHQGVRFRSDGDPVLYLKNPEGIASDARRSLLDALGKLAGRQQALSKDPDILSRVSQYEMGYRMQSSVPDVADITKEPANVLEMYGPNVTREGTFARNALIACRLAERGVKFITLFQLGWDHHGNVSGLLPGMCEMVDQPAAALVKDLKQRGLLDDTLVVFGSEFGRTPFAQGALVPGFGRDHHGGNFTWWMAGGGVKGGYTHGETDDFSYSVVKDGVHIHDFNATLLWLLGIDHERLTFKYQGRDFRLTDVHGKVVNQLIA
jgi:hypothetical protein